MLPKKNILTSSALDAIAGHSEPGFVSVKKGPAALENLKFISRSFPLHPYKMLWSGSH
jgi:hypothetical protein